MIYDNMMHRGHSVRGVSLSRHPIHVTSTIRGSTLYFVFMHCRIKLSSRSMNTCAVRVRHLKLCTEWLETPDACTTGMLYAIYM